MASVALSSRPSVTIVTPARAADATLARMFAAVARQSVRAWEHLVVAGPRDSATLRAIREQAARDPRITLLVADAETAGAARNAALASMSGDYVLFLDADDTIAPRHVERLLRRAEETGADAICGGYRRLSPTGQVIGTRRPAPGVEGRLAEGPVTAIHAMLFRSGLIRELRGFDARLRTNEDWDLCLRARDRGARFAVSDTTSADYWTGHRSLTGMGPAMVEDRREVASRAARRAGEEGDARRSCDDALESVLWNGAVALARGASPLGLAAWVEPIPPAQADPRRAAEALLDGLTIGFACRAERVEARLGGHWAELDRFLEAVAGRTGDVGLGDAIRRSFEWQLARLGSAWRSRAIGSSDVRCLTGLVARYRAGDATSQVIARVPLLRPRALATQAFAPQVVAGRRPLALLPARLRDRLLQLPASGQGRSAHARDTTLRALVLGRRIVRRLAGVRDAAPVADDDPQDLAGDDRWEAIFGTEDPWNYTCEYERLKYERTLSLLPDRPIGRALELACAEGLFSLELAPRVERLTASDISPTALARARTRCDEHGLTNVSFEELDFFRGDIGAGWDLIVCSEVLYYMDSPQAVTAFAGRVADALAPDGLFLHAHAYEVTDTPHRSGFDWGDNFAAGAIAASLQAERGLSLARAIETELYRIELYCKSQGATLEPEIEHASARPGLHPELAADVVWNGAIVTRPAAEAKRCYRVPVLMYHSVARAGPAALADWRVDPDDFERQLVFLRRRGYRPLGLDEWERARRRSGALGGRPIMLTFDDGLQDFAATAWPIVQRNGFGAHVFLVSGRVGGTADWDAGYGDPAPLMGWDTIRALADEGVTFGSHLHTHRPLDRIGFAEAEREMRLSRELIGHHTGIEPTSLATPYGISSRAFAELARAAGYSWVFGVDGGRAPVLGPRLHTPRIEIDGAMTLDEFAAAIHAAEVPDGRDALAP
jgi:peptidoglycan/xylan/chitin deacetylase (PgdA/CDA1 family)